ncbi:hypothetical protein U1Q18_031301, partial [Sarracenia purpurea var. burkii]
MDTSPPPSMVRPNRFSILQTFGNEEDLKISNVPKSRARGPRSGKSIIEEAMSIRGNLKGDDSGLVDVRDLVEVDTKIEHDSTPGGEHMVGVDSSEAKQRSALSLPL